MIWLAAIPAFLVLVIVHACWKRRRTLPGARPVPYWPASTSPCTWCKPSPEGTCTCTSVCGHVRCIGDHTSMATLTPEDVRWLRQQQIRGHE